jgi:hypothetical protein
MTKYSRFIHPNSVCMTYFQHMRFSMSISRDMLLGSYQAFIHGIFPNYYITSTTDFNKKLIKKLRNSGCNLK